MEYRYTEIPKEKAKKLREKFIESFVNTTNWQYEKLIRDVKADDIIKHYEGYMVSYLWCCLRDDIAKRWIRFEEAAELLKKINGEAYIMWDIRTKEVIYPEKSPVENKYPPYTNFDADTVLKAEIKEIYNIVTHDHNSKIWDQFLGEDVYVFDDTFKWYIAFTHEYEKDGMTMCYTNING